MQLNKLFFMGFFLFTSNVFCYNGEWDEFCKAVSSNDLATVKQMLSQGTDINARSILGCPAVMHAIHHPKILYLLLTHGANVYARNAPIEHRRRIRPSRELNQNYNALEFANLINKKESVDLINAWITHLENCKNHFILTINSSNEKLLPELANIVYQYNFDDETFAKYIYQNAEKFPKFEYKNLSENY